MWNLEMGQSTIFWYAVILQLLEALYIFNENKMGLNFLIDCIIKIGTEEQS